MISFLSSFMTLLSDFLVSSAFFPVYGMLLLCVIITLFRDITNI